MKSFSCGEVVPGCTARWTCATTEEILASVGRHAAEAHGLLTIPDEVVAEVRRHILTV